MKGTEVPNPRRSSACDSTLKLAIGARVMLTANVDVLLMVLEVKWSGMRMLRQPGRAR